MNDSFKLIRYRGQDIKVGLDDSDQCYYFTYKGKEYGCGTYNADYLSEIIAAVDADLDEVFYVKPIACHRPSAKAYKRHGVWYCDYLDFDGLILSYGELNGENPAKPELTDRARKLMLKLDRIAEDVGKDLD